MNVLKEIRFRLGSARRARELHREIAGLRAELQKREPSSPPLINASNLVWIFGAPRSGTSWLSRMLSDLPSSTWWNEPDVGRLFGAFYQDWYKKAEREGFILADAHRNSYLKGLRTLVLDGARSRYVQDGKAPENIIVKEPNGSVGAPLLSAAMPQSRVILLIRDPRDALASMLEASKEGNWLYTRPIHQQADWRETNEADTDPAAHLRRRASEYVDVMSGALEAYEAHPGPKISVRYEDLLGEPHKNVADIANALNIEADQSVINSAVAKFAYENVPDKAKGYGKAIRNARVGGWREELSEKQVAVVECITANFLSEFGYERMT